MNNLIRAAVIFFGFWAFAIAMSLPYAYASGVARAEYLQANKGIVMHWYKAAWLPSEVFIDARIRND